MRERKWVLFVFALLVIIVIAYLYGLQYFKANERIKNYVLEQIRPMLGENCTISEVKLGFGNVRFTDVDIPLPDKQFDVSVENIRVGFNLFKMLVQGINAQTISQDILIDHPSLYIRVQQSDTTQKVLSYPNFSEIKDTYKKQFQRLEILNRLSIIDGELYYQVHDSLNILLAHSIEGGFFVDKADSIDLRLTGKLFNSNEANLNILARAHNKKGTISHIRAELMRYKLKDYIPEELVPDLRFTSGEVNGVMNLERIPGKEGFDLSGDLRIKDAGAELYDDIYQITDMNLVSHIEDWNLIVDNASQRINDSYMEITGKIYNVVFPYFDLQLKSPHVEFENFSPLLEGNFAEKFDGSVEVDAHLSGTITNFDLVNRIHADSLLYNKVTVKNIDIDSRFNKNKFYFNQCDFNLLSNQISLLGVLDLGLDGKPMLGNLSIEGDMTRELMGFGADKLEKFGTSLSADIYGSLESPIVDGAGRIQLVSQDLDTTLLPVHVLLAENKLEINPDSSSDITASINLSSPLSWDIQFEELQKYILPHFHMPFADYFLKNFSVSGRLSGTNKEHRLFGRINRVEGGYFRNGFANVQMEFSNKKQLNGWGKFDLYPDEEYRLDGEFRFHQEKNKIVLNQFNLADQLFANVTLTDYNLLSGNVSAKSLEISDFYKTRETKFNGTLDMNLDISGSRQYPKLKSELDLKDLRYETLGPYSAHMEIGLDSANLSVPHLTLNSSDATLLYTQGSYNTLSDSLDFFVKGAGFNFEEIFITPEDEEPAFIGNGLVDISLTGSARNPRVEGLFAVKDGSVYDVPFDEIEVDLGAGESDYAGLFIDDFRLTRHDYYEVRGNGIYPFHNRDSLYINLTGEGNFLQILSDKVNFFKEPHSDCEFNASVSGSPENPVLEAATLKLENGDMYCNGVIPPMTELRGDFEFVPDDQFIHAKYITGKMGGKPFRISNTLAPVNSSKPLENILIGDTGLSLGIVIPQSFDKGVPLNIEGLMEPGVYGNLEMIGRDGEDHFYFAWIDGNPTFRGTIQLYDTEIMYPFYEGTSTPDPVVEDFFMRMEWDILVKPIQDVRYVKTFPGAIDNVYVNLQINEKYSELGFAGQLKDESFRIIGEARSTKGVIEYLGMDFRIERAGAEFDKSTLEPVVYGNARTTVADSAGIPSQIYLTMQTHDITMDKKPVDDIARLEDTRGRWNQIRFKLSSDNPSVGASERQILSTLGYSNATLQQNPAIDAIGFGTENLILRPLIRPVEKSLEKTFGLDYVRFSSMFAKNLLEFNLNNNLRVNNRLSLLKSTRLVVGKYIVDNVFFQYTGQVESGIDYRYKDINVGLHHRMGLEYQINPRLLLELEYDYDSLIWQRENRDDKRIVLRHWFPF